VHDIVGLILRYNNLSPAGMRNRQLFWIFSRVLKTHSYFVTHAEIYARGSGTELKETHKHLSGRLAYVSSEPCADVFDVVSLKNDVI